MSYCALCFDWMDKYGDEDVVYGFSVHPRCADYFRRREREAL